MNVFVTTGALPRQEENMKSVLAVALGLIVLVTVSGKSTFLCSFT